MRSFIALLIASLTLSACNAGPTEDQVNATVNARLTALAPTALLVLPTATPTAARTHTPRPTLTPTYTPTPTPPRAAARVTRIIDGDTIEVTINDQAFSVRYIGIDTPERDEFGYAEATEANRKLVAGRTVFLETDVSETDRFGRLLRYAYLGDGTFVNAELVRLGYAQAATFPPDVKYQDLFTQLEREAREASRGLWGQPTATATRPPLPTNTRLPAPTATRPPAPTATQILPTATAPVANCDPAYADVCIPPPPPDLDCGDIPYRRFRVLPPDPHGFDRDQDGIGCES